MKIKRIIVNKNIIPYYINLHGKKEYSNSYKVRNMVHYVLQDIISEH